MSRDHRTHWPPYLSSVCGNFARNTVDPGPGFGRARFFEKARRAFRSRGRSTLTYIVIIARSPLIRHYRLVTADGRRWRIVVDGREGDRDRERRDEQSRGRARTHATRPDGGGGGGGMSINGATDRTWWTALRGNGNRRRNFPLVSDDERDGAWHGATRARVRRTESTALLNHQTGRAKNSFAKRMFCICFRSDVIAAATRFARHSGNLYGEKPMKNDPFWISIIYFSRPNYNGATGGGG